MVEPPDAPLHVVATAGHVDHGKSRLIVRLTGIDPDRLAEEKRRGLTIDLGFAWCTLPSGREIGFVDVPGHERFVRNMLAGVGPVRLVLFVVAADEGWKPQSEEHLQIVDVLGTRAGVVALTKSDLVDAQTLERVRGEIRARLVGTTIADAPIVACSAVTGIGLDELAAALDAMIASAPVPETDGRPRLFVDRVFPIRGAGTVVTGTLIDGPIRVGDDAELLPSGTRARIRGLQTHRRRIDVAHPVSRVAVNLAGTERERVGRGEVLGPPDRWRPTSVFEAWMRPVRGVDVLPMPRGAYRLHAGSAERDARLRLYGSADAGAYARIRLSAPLVLDVFDRFVLRDVGRARTVAGGVVLDPMPPTRPGRDAVERLARRRDARPEDLPALLVAERGAVSAREVRLLTGREPADVAGAGSIGGWWVAERLASAARDRVRARLEAFHAADAVALGEEASTVRTWIAEALRSTEAARDTSLLDAVTSHLVERGLLAREGSKLRLADHRPSVAGREHELRSLIDAVAAGEPTPPTIADLRAKGFGLDLIDAAVRTGALVRVAPDLVMTDGFVERAVEVVRSASGAGVTVSAFREALGTSRKYAVPLLEHFDQRGLTVRRGDVRFSRGAG
jgi:selenocysteine-specific elongation factor